MVDALTPDDLRKLAANEFAWAESRMVTYREDGAPVPEPIRKCHGLADAVLKFLPGMGAATGSITEEAEHLGEKLRQAREGIYAIGMMLQTLNANLDGSPFIVTGPTSPHVCGQSGKGSDVGAVPCDHTSALRADASPSPATAPMRAVAGAADGRWPESGLYHGLVLANAAGERRLFAEPIQGQYVVQTVASDGLTAGEPWSTMADKWPADTWHQASPLAIAPALRRYDDATGKVPARPKAADRTLALPGMGDVAPVAKPEVVRKTIADYAPGAVQFTTWTAAFSKAAGKTIEETRVRELFATWQIANATEEKPNPAAAFWQYARAILVGNAT